MIRDMPEMITPDALAKYTGISAHTIRRQCRDGVIPATKIGVQWVIPRDLVFANLIEMEEKLEQ